MTVVQTHLTNPMSHQVWKTPAAVAVNPPSLTVVGCYAVSTVLSVWLRYVCMKACQNRFFPYRSDFCFHKCKVNSLLPIIAYLGNAELLSVNYNLGLSFVALDASPHSRIIGLTFRHRASSIQDRCFATVQRTLFIYLINKYISLSDICLTLHH